MAKPKNKKAKDKSKAKSSGPLKSIWLFALIPAIAAILAYAGTSNHGYVLDDSSAITDNTVVKLGLDGVPTIWKTHYRYGYWSNAGSLYRPLALTLFAWQWQMWPNDPGAAHVMNILLYAIGCVVLFFLLHAWFGRGDPWLATIITLIFALHPIHTEVVANIKSADELLAFVFSGLALLALWKNGDRLFSPWIIAALASFFLALASKESVVTLIPIAALANHFFKAMDWKKNLITTAWLILPLIAYLALRSSVLGGLTGQGVIASFDNILVNVKGMDRYASALYLCGMYLMRLILPHPLSHDYSKKQIEIVGFDDPMVWLALLAYGALAFLAVRTFRSKPIISFAILFFLLTFSLYSNLVLTIGTHFGERLLFLPSVGFAIAVGWLIWKWGEQAGQFNPAKAVLPSALLAVGLLAYGFKTVDRNADWASEVDLYEADVITSSKSARVHHRLGMAYMKEKALKTNNEQERTAWLQKSMVELKKAIEIMPKYTDAHSELGIVYHRMGMREEALKQYERTLEISDLHYITHSNMGSVLFELGRYAEAVPHFERALELHPRYQDAIGNLASSYGMLGNFEKAIYWFKKGIEIAPSEASYYYFLGITYNNMGNPQEAKKWLDQAYQLNPSLRPK